MDDDNKIPPMHMHPPMHSHPNMNGQGSEDSSHFGSDPDNRSEIRVLVENSKIGKVIGKGGTRVKAIRNQSGASIFIRPGSGECDRMEERVVSIRGHISQIEIAIQVLCNFVHEDNTSGSGQLTLLAHKSLIGAVIGRGGSKIKHTTQVTGAMIHISTEALSNSSEKSITIYGPTVSVTHAVIVVIQQLVDEILRPGERVIQYEPQEGKSEIIHMKPREHMDKDPMMPSGMGMPGMSKSPYMPSVMPSHRPSKRLRISPNNSPYEMSGGPSKRLRISPNGNPYQIPGGQAGLIPSPLGDIDRQGMIQQPDFFSGSPLGMKQQGGPMNNPFAHFGPQSFPEPNALSLVPESHIFDGSKSVGPTMRTAVFIIPSAAVGQIIGKGGAGITFIKQQTGTHIRISEVADGEKTDERSATIKGPPAGVQSAMFMLNQILDMHYGSIEAMGRQGFGSMEGGMVRPSYGSIDGGMGRPSYGSINAGMGRPSIGMHHPRGRGRSTSNRLGGRSEPIRIGGRSSHSRRRHSSSSSNRSSGKHKSIEILGGKETRESIIPIGMGHRELAGGDVSKFGVIPDIEGKSEGVESGDMREFYAGRTYEEEL